MVDEYIKRESVHKSLDDLSSEHLIGNDDDTFISLAKAHDRIEELPAADVVEVVRCKDCIHWSKKIGMCLYCYGLHYNAINPSKENDYCSYGERQIK